MDLFFVNSVLFCYIGILSMDTLTGTGFWDFWRGKRTKPLKHPWSHSGLSSDGFSFPFAVTSGSLGCLPRVKDLTAAKPQIDAECLKWLTHNDICLIRSAHGSMPGSGQVGELESSRFPPFSFYLQSNCCMSHGQDILAGSSDWLKSVGIFFWWEKDQTWFCNHYSPQAALVQSVCSCK